MSNSHTSSRWRAGMSVVIACAALTLTGCGGSGSKPDDSAANAKTEEVSQKTAEQSVAVVPIEKHVLHAEIDLPGQLLAYQDVPMHAKIKGYISSIYVDRGSFVHQGQLLAVITAPEINANVKESEAKQSAAESAYLQSQADYQAAVSKRQQEKAKLEADQLTYSRLEQANKTPGAVAQNEVDLARQAVESDKSLLDNLAAQVKASESLVQSHKQDVAAAANVVTAQRAMRSYLEIKAPFDGVITERNVHEGSIVDGDPSRDGLPMLRIQEKSLLRLVVAVPEAAVSGIKLGLKVPFTVPAFPGKTFNGVVARPGFALDDKTRTMPVEMNVPNQDGQLEPGMFATVSWVVTRPYSTLFVPSSAVTSDLKSTFVNLIGSDGVCRRISVTRGQQMGNLVEVISNDLHEGDMVALKATDEYKDGSKLAAKLADKTKIEEASKHTSSGGE